MSGNRRRTSEILVCLCLMLGLAAPMASLAQDPYPTALPAIPQKGPYEPGQLLVKFRAGLLASQQEAILSGVGAKSVGQLERIGVEIIEVDEGLELTTAEALEAKIGVVYAEPNYTMSLLAEPNDPYWVMGRQGHLGQIGLPRAWDMCTGDPSVVVAVLDTGVDATHPDLVGQILPGTDVFGEDTDNDKWTHGTVVAGLIAADSNNALGTAGIAWDCRVLPVRVSDWSDTSVDKVAEGVGWAVEHGAMIINMSLGCRYDSQTLRAAIEDASDQGVLLIAAAGSSGQITMLLGRDAVQYPAAYDQVIAVGSVNNRDVVATYSPEAPEIALTAPGGDPEDQDAGTDMIQDEDPTHWVWSTASVDYWFWDILHIAGQDYGKAYGTSMAAAHVSGVAALVMSANPDLSAAEVEQILYDTAVDLGLEGRDQSYGYGRVDAAAALAAALNVPVPSPEPGATPVRAPTPQGGIDPDEPNDNIGGAATIAVGQYVVRALDPNDVDVFRFTVSERSGVRIGTRTNGEAINMQLVSSSGEVLATGFDNGEGIATMSLACLGDIPLEPGDHWIKVYPSAAGGSVAGYILLVELIPCDSGGISTPTPAPAASATPTVTVTPWTATAFGWLPMIVTQ